MSLNKPFLSNCYTVISNSMLKLIQNINNKLSHKQIENLASVFAPFRQFIYCFFSAEREAANKGERLNGFYFEAKEVTAYF